MKNKPEILSVILTTTPLVMLILTVLVLLPIYSMDAQDIEGPYFQFVSLWTSLIVPIMVASFVCMVIGICRLIWRKP